MSVGQAAASYAQEIWLAQRTRRLREFGDRYSPNEGWETFALIFAAVGLAIWTVGYADWVETPGLMGIVIWSSVSGLALGKVRWPWPVTLLIGLLFGLFVVAWQATSFAPGLPLPDQLSDLAQRFAAFYEAASTGGISTDLMPFAALLLTGAWLLGFLGAWFLFRFGNIWVGLVAAGVAILTNLSFLPDYFAAKFGPISISMELVFLLFMFVAMLLVARRTLMERHEDWRLANIGVLARGGGVALRTIAGLSVAVLLLSALLPLKVYVNSVAVNLWNVGRSPIEGMEDEFARLFSGIVSHRDVAGRFFGKTLPFQGKISFGGDVVIWANSERPAYWVSRTYSKYTSLGWIAGDTQSQTVGPDSLPPPPQEALRRIPLFQSLQLTFSTKDMLHGGNIDWVSRDATVETLAPLKFTINLNDKASWAELPAELRTLASDLNDQLNAVPRPASVESHAAKMLPPDMRLIEVHPKTQNAVRFDRVVVERKSPTVPDVTAWRFTEPLEENGNYVMRALVSDATYAELGRAGIAYSGFIKDHYLQIPSTLPERVRELAADITEDAASPLDKALALQDWLRGPELTYSQDIDKPPSDEDAVDNFLFETKTGYSDYYASSMAVMLRSVGVPARLAAGYAPGEAQSDTRRRAVRDSDSHGWVQVYFPGYGWIDFEPTPAWPLPERGPAPQAAPAEATEQVEEEPVDLGGLSTTEDVQECFNDAETAEEEEECLTAAGLLDLDEDFGDLGDIGASTSLLRLLAPLLGLFAILAATWILGWALWTRGLGKATPAERAYIKLSRLGALAGLRRPAHHTPLEYARWLGSAIPTIAVGTQSVAWSFATGRYGDPEISQQSTEDLESAWRSIRGGLLARVARRLVPVGRASATP